MESKLYHGSKTEQDALRAFCRDYLENTFWPYEEFALSLKIPQTFLLYWQEAESDWTGFALGRVMGGVSELFFIFLKPDVRGKGLAGLILSAFERHSQTAYQAESILLEVRVSNHSAIRLYDKAGYQCINTRKRYYQDGEDALIYIKKLVPDLP